MGGIAVMIGAFGAHALKPLLISTGRLDTYELAVRYQFYHALAMLFIGALMPTYQSKLLRYASLSLLFGILFFSGSLYVLCFTGLGILGTVTPIGGVFFILGWILLSIGVYKNRSI